MRMLELMLQFKKVCEGKTMALIGLYKGMLVLLIITFYSINTPGLHTYFSAVSPC